MEQAIKRSPRLHPYLYIYRSRNGGFWWCAVPYLDRKGRRRQWRKSFRDNHYQARNLALRAAQRWRDLQIQIPEVRMAMGDRRPLVLVETREPGKLGGRNNPFGLVGITATFRKKPLGGNFSVTANRGRKKWFSMRRYGAFGAFKLAVLQRCKWVGASMPPEEDLRARYDRWVQGKLDVMREHALEP